MLAETWRDGLAVNEKWHDMICDAGTNQAACQSLLTFTEVSFTAVGAAGGVLVCLHICREKKSVLHLFFLLSIIQFCFPLFESIPRFFALCYISVCGIKLSLPCRFFSLHCKDHVWSRKSSATTAFLLIFCRKSVFVFCIQLRWLLLCMRSSKLRLCLLKTKHNFHQTWRKETNWLDVCNKRAWLACFQSRSVFTNWSDFCLLLHSKYYFIDNGKVFIYK